MPTNSPTLALRHKLDLIRLGVCHTHFLRGCALDLTMRGSVIDSLHDGTRDRATSAAVRAQIAGSAAASGVGSGAKAVGHDLHLVRDEVEATLVVGFGARDFAVSWAIVDTFDAHYGVGARACWARIVAF